MRNTMVSWLKTRITNFRRLFGSIMGQLDQGLSSSDHLSIEHRLGPHSTKTVTHTSSITGSATIVSMQQEMYKDALYFYSEARTKHAKKDADPFVTRRNLRAAILFSFAAIESCINQFIDSYVESNKASMPQEKIDRWTEKDRLVWINEKLNEGVELFGRTRLDKDTGLWQDFRELKDLRNDLVHYKVANRVFYNTDELLKRVEKGIRTASAVIKKIHLSHPANVAFPKIFDELP
jgi:hypothetical protein